MLDLAMLKMPLLAWYDREKRSLPWRKVCADPYEVWVSEIMLQQTRVETVKDYYTRFLDALPTVADLARADEAILMKLWQGLGYYSRVRNMAKAAKIVMEKFSGSFPISTEDLRALPGIGDYTAGAIASIAFHQPEPAVDGNVERILSRVTGQNLERAVFAKALKEVYPAAGDHRCSDFTQALMELGATVCLPNGAPLCGICPWAELCVASKTDRINEFPAKKVKAERKIVKLTVFLIGDDTHIVLHQRKANGLLAGLWEFPNVEGELDQDEVRAYLEKRGLKVGKLKKLSAQKHIFTHIEWHMTPWQIEAGTLPDDWVSAAYSDLQNAYALPTAFRKLLSGNGRQKNTRRKLS